MSRFVKVDNPPMSPAQCKICGTGTRGPFIDMQYAEDYYGSVYYCMDCAGELAGVLGFVHPDKYQTLIQENLMLEQNIAKFEERVTQEQHVKAVLDDIIKRYDESNSPVSINSDGIPTEIPLGTVEIVDPGTPVIDEPSDEQGLANVFKVASQSTNAKRSGRTQLVDI